ncbi:hypothetical protein [Methylobacter sp. S3L5C]|uniref:hypothetical protein n=1 Tax=Methylobacter sp. S3L5C TaxID=2839024 RepID=UPI001FAD50CA|nr:hypothetical protein [Methylobacter sp. S3L5C]UOA07762.1 hypothetical protein KKZ03_16110 [Methylobacter sp. S3L5C]
MMKTCLSKSKSLKAQINAMEQIVLIRQRKVSVRTTILIGKIHQQMTTPTTLLLAGGIGFIIGELTKRRTPGSGSHTDQSITTETSPLTTALNLIVSAHTLYMALPVAWIMQTFNQSRASSDKQAHPAPNNINDHENHRSSMH